MHDWSDEWFEQYGKDLYEAQQYIHTFTKRWARCNLCSKEKYGTIRYEWVFPPYGGIYWVNGYSRIWNSSWLYRKWTQFGWYVCAIAIKKAIKKWPHLEVELSCDYMADNKFGIACRAKYWTSV